jgi:hypothetical protein
VVLWRGHLVHRFCPKDETIQTQALALVYGAWHAFFAGANQRRRRRGCTRSDTMRGSARQGGGAGPLDPRNGSRVRAEGTWNRFIFNLGVLVWMGAKFRSFCTVFDI